MTRAAECHPDRKHHAKGLCYACYLAAWRAAHPEAGPASARRYRERHPDAHRTYYLANQARVKAAHKRRYDRDPSVRLRRIAAKYGMTMEDRAALLARGCEICGDVATHVDHDHDTGAVRGALCGACNTGIGQLKDDPDIVARAAAYLANRKNIILLRAG